MCDSTTSESSSSFSQTKEINPDLSPVMSTKGEMSEAATGKSPANDGAVAGAKQNQVGSVMLFGVPIVSLVMDGKERLCLAQISSTLLKDFSYNEIHNRRVALGINCVQCTPVQLEILRRAGAMPVTSRRCGMITRREAERLCKSFLGDHAPPQLPENFAFDVYHECGWGCRGSFVPSRYNSSRAKCIRCSFCQLFFSPNKFIFHSHRLPESRYVQPDAANFNSWRRHMKLCGDPPEEANSSNSVSDLATAQIVHAWEDVKAMFNGGTRKRLLAASTAPSTHHHGGGRHNSSSHNTSASGKGNASSRNNNNNNSHSSHGENQNTSGNGTGNNASSRNGGGTSHQVKKDSSGSASSASAAAAAAAAQQAQHAVPPGMYNQDAPHHPTNFLHQSQNPFLNVSNPLLSPSGRLDSIWNPAISGSMPGVVGQGPRSCQIPGPAPFPTLPLHPLSIPWLRRPIFPFTHPFGPTLLNEQGNNPTVANAPEKLVNLALARQNQSAFKPVSRSVEPLFNWLNGSSLGTAAAAAAAAGAMGLTGNTIATLPEDLSLSSGGGGHAPGTPANGGAPGNPHFNTANNSASVGSTYPLNNKHMDSSSSGGSGDKSCRSNNNNNNNGSASAKHQIQILSAHQNESDDDENVDIESTVEMEECSSTTSSVWVSSTTAHPGSGGGGRTRASTPRIASPYNNNNNNNIIIDFNRRKRVAPSCYSSGEEVDEDQDSSTDNPDDAITIDNYDDVRSSSSAERESKMGKKRKRLWVNEVVTTDEEDTKLSKSLSKGGTGKGGESRLHRNNSAARALLERRE